MLPEIDKHSIGERIRAARRLRGFRSAAVAAKVLGWKIGKISSHENGQARASDEHLRLYAEGLGVSETWLSSGVTSTPDDVDAAALLGLDRRFFRAKTSESIARAAHALRHVRKARGFRSAASARRHFGFAHSTYTRHEQGTMAISPEAATLYAVAFGVPEAYFDATVLEMIVDPSLLTATTTGTAADVDTMRKRMDARKIRASCGATVRVYTSSSVGDLRNDGAFSAMPVGDDDAVIDGKILDDIGGSAADLAILRLPSPDGGGVDFLLRTSDRRSGPGTEPLLFVQGNKTVVFTSDRKDEVVGLSPRSGGGRSEDARMFPVVSVSVTGGALEAFIRSGQLHIEELGNGRAGRESVSMWKSAAKPC